MQGQIAIYHGTIAGSSSRYNLDVDNSFEKGDLFTTSPLVLLLLLLLLYSTQLFPTHSLPATRQNPFLHASHVSHTSLLPFFLFFLDFSHCSRYRPPSPRQWQHSRHSERVATETALHRYWLSVSFVHCLKRFRHVLCSHIAFVYAYRIQHFGQSQSLQSPLSGHAPPPTAMAPASCCS
jgi:hypothetical protein